MSICTRRSRLLLALAAGVGWLAVLARLSAAADDNTIAVRTVYLRTSIGKYHQITLEGKLGDKAQLTGQPSVPGSYLRDLSAGV